MSFLRMISQATYQYKISTKALFNLSTKDK